MRGVAVLLVYLALAATVTRPLLSQAATRIAGDAGDPILNTSILWWNATTVPFSKTWWNPPYFYPTSDVSAFTENLQGISALATPIFWLTGSPLATYNLALFLTWPLSAFAAYLLVRRLTGRDDAAFLAGLAYGFSPYRTAELGHLQMVSSYWIPLALLGLHAYLVQRRARWLVLFGAAWALQSLANGYLMLFGAVLIGLWLLYFCSTMRAWRAAPGIVAAWALGSVPLLPVMLKYRAVHEHEALRRALDNPLGFSAPVRAFGEVSPLVWFWGRVLPPSNDDLFPGITAVVLLFAAALFLTMRRRREEPAAGSSSRRILTAGLLLLTGISLTAILVTALAGPWRITVAGVVIRMAVIDRAVLGALLGVLPLVFMAARPRAALRRRSPLLFYALVTVAFAICSCGPVLRVGNDVVWQWAPYRWLMLLPGFDELRVPTRFWMLGIFCLAVAAGLAFDRLPFARPRWRTAVFFLATAGLLLDGWLVGVPMAVAPEPWPKVERRDQAQPILELPLGPEWDAAATFRSMWHRRRVVNGVSGYDPAHYAPLQAGLNAHDPGMLLALASLGSFDAIVSDTVDRDGGWAKYVSGLPGVVRLASDGARTAYRVPLSASPDPAVGADLPIAQVRAVRGEAGVMVDGRLETEWRDIPQQPDQWVTVDLGRVQEVGGVTHALGEYARDFPRLLAIDLSADGAAWEEVWRGTTSPLAFLAAARAPREAAMHMTFAARPARFVRLRQLAHHQNFWRIAELKIHAPAR